jgi:hypothetical protein
VCLEESGALVSWCRLDGCGVRQAERRDQGYGYVAMLLARHIAETHSDIF